MPCIFCGHLSVSNGHVLPDFLKQIEVEPKPSLTRRGKVHATQRNPALYSEKARVVCQQRCNGGWMSQIEEAAKPVLLDLITGQPGQLNPQGQAVLARWAALAALMACYLQPKIEVPRDYPATFYGLKEPPAITIVWIATYDLAGGYAESYKRGPLPNGWQTQAPLVLPTGTVQPTSFNGYRVTINVWHLAFKVDVLAPPPDWHESNARYRIKLDRTIPGVVPIWPMAQGRIIEWPITPQLDNIGLSALANAMPVITPQSR
jgi:hypothetical protein